MVEKIIIRKANDDEIDAVVGIALDAWKPIYEMYREAMGEDIFNAMYPDWKKIKEHEILNAYHGGHETYVAVEGDKVVGFISYYNDAPSIGIIGNNAVHPEYQGRGIGSLMYRYIFDRMRKNGMAYASVSTGGDPAHAPARRAYEKAGFQIKIENVDYYKKL